MKIFKSKYSIGQKVRFETEEASCGDVYIRAVTFATGKVRYAIFFPKSKTTLHNVDSYFIRDAITKGKMEFEFDNFS